MNNFNDIQDTFQLSNGVKIPCVGFGTFQMDNSLCENAVETAISYGYRHIDTASFYNNEQAVGNAIKKSNISRDEIFITSKLWNNIRGYDETIKAFNETINRLNVEYLDLYLIHWPIPYLFKDNWENKNLESWRAFEHLYKLGKIKSIGVSNFLEHHLLPLMEKSVVPPMVNQLEIHPAYPQKEIRSFCNQNNILVESWGPLMQGEAFNNKVIICLAEKYSKTPAQICIKWAIDNGILPLPKSQHSNRIFENTQGFDFSFSDNDKISLEKLSILGSVSVHPDKITF